MTAADLFARMAEDFRRFSAETASDGIGGTTLSGEAGPVFRAFVQPVRESLTDTAPDRPLLGRTRLTAERNVASASLARGDTVMRQSDGAVFRITGEVFSSPAGASFQLITAEAEAAV